jgi:outer membrane lipoprotein-sorting protein
MPKGSGTPLQERVITLLYRARLNLRSIIATLRYRADRKQTEQVRGQWESSIGRQSLASPLEKSNLESELMDYRWELWWNRPTFWRLDETNLATSHVVRYLVDQKQSMIYSSKAKTLFKKAEGDSATTQQQLPNKKAEAEFTEASVAAWQQPSLDPSFLLSSHSIELEEIEGITFLDRPAYRVWAYPRPDRDAAIDALFWSSADKYELIVDARVGMLLKYTAYAQERAFASVTVKSLKVNIKMPDKILELPIPEGTKIVIP